MLKYGFTEREESSFLLPRGGLLESPRSGLLPSLFFSFSKRGRRKETDGAHRIFTREERARGDARDSFSVDPLQGKKIKEKGKKIAI